LIAVQNPGHVVTQIVDDRSAIVLFDRGVIDEINPIVSQQRVQVHTLASAPSHFACRTWISRWPIALLLSSGQKFGKSLKSAKIMLG
jgi:hypothetical protein